MKKLYFLFLISLLFFLGCNRDSYDNVLNQFGPVHSLVEGNYDGVFTFKQLFQYGDFGLGTFDHINGELVVLDGQFFQITSNGLVHEVLSETTSPFASIHFFQKDDTLLLSQINDLSSLKSALWDSLDSTLVYGIKIPVLCSTITLRSPKAQHKPYPDLKTVIDQQAVFHHQNLRGTLVGYFSPAFFSGVLVNDVHLHFISDDHRIGGHVLNVSFDDAIADIDRLSEIRVHLLPE